MNQKLRDQIFIRAHYLCEICGEHIYRFETPQIAHCIKQGKGSENYIGAFIWNEFIKDRGATWIRERVIDNPKNLKATCSLKCNDKCNIFFKDVERDELLKEIISEEILKDKVKKD